MEIDEVLLNKLKKRFEEIKGQRIEEARKLGIYSMVATVTEELGSTFAVKHGDLHVFPPMTWEEFRRVKPTDYELYMLYDDYGHNIDVWYKGRKVFRANLGDVTLYIPGEWVEELKKLYAVAKDAMRKRWLKRELEALKKEAEKWGLTLKDLGIDEVV